MEFAPESSSAGPSGYGQMFYEQQQQQFPFVDEEQPSTSTAASVPVSVQPKMEAETNYVNWQLDDRSAAVLNDNVRTFIYNRTDPHIQHDMRTFYNLMEHEEALQPNYHYFTAVQEHVTPFHREQAVDWIFDVAQEEKCDGDVYLLAVAIIDRFLSFQNILKHDIQMIAGVALFIASKLKAPHPLTASKIAYYSDNTCPIDMLLQWELLIVTTLQWETESPTAFSFFDQLAARIPQIHNLRGPFQLTVQKCQRMHKLATLFPSMQCAIALYYVSRRDDACVELALAIRNLLASMFQLQVNLLDSYMPMVERCLNPAPIYSSEESIRAEAAPAQASTAAPASAPLAVQELSPKELSPILETISGFETPEEPEVHEELPKEPSTSQDYTVPLQILDQIPESDQTPSTPLNDSGSARTSGGLDDDSTPPKIFKHF
ncbi:unnamed protein product [Caenorhabditis sp. 36 PRJEB53466]|nr:unnamed protein product [Caenorhabditis sp. 36 PRJEB53466]